MRVSKCRKTVEGMHGHMVEFLSFLVRDQTLHGIARIEFYIVRRVTLHTFSNTLGKAFRGIGSTRLRFLTLHKTLCHGNGVAGSEPTLGRARMTRQPLQRHLPGPAMPQWGRSWWIGEGCLRIRRLRKERCSLRYRR